MSIPIEVTRLTKRYQKGRHVVEVLHDVTLSIGAGERVAMIGPSGSGKSTFLHMVGLLDRPTSGSIRIGGKDIAGMSDRQRHPIRNRNVGFVFQSHNLLPGHSALGNVMVPVRLAGGGKRIARARAQAMLEAVGLSDRAHHKPGELSGGEQQRVALARALVMQPGLLLADEPTGNLDPETASGVFDLMLELNRQLGSTLVMVTHSRALANRFSRVLSLEERRFVEAT